MLQKKTKRVLSLATALALVCTGISLPDSNVAKAAKKAKLKTKKISLKVGKKKKIAISGKVKKAKYTFKSSKKAVASVSKSGVVTAKKKGNAVITVKEKKKKKTKVIGKVKVTVKAVKAVTPSKPQTKPNTAGDKCCANGYTFKTDGYTNKCTDANAGSEYFENGR